MDLRVVFTELVFRNILLEYDEQIRPKAYRLRMDGRVGNEISHEIFLEVFTKHVAKKVKP